MMSVVIAISRRAFFIHSMRRMYSSRVYRRCMRSSTRLEPDCTGRCT